ncbi:hypothetical protein A6X21_04030 [Planctopirus hydrillae]|uniref:Uncharacterized protein n=1 Tax=Planctopirus hydrillae TaxID=1841610 RepID=A0A1C3ENK0_9PLAN|nr:hypothetical protein A6X21_04030 [Planctopirus hydrillae]
MFQFLGAIFDSCEIFLCRNQTALKVKWIAVRSMALCNAMLFVNRQSRQSGLFGIVVGELPNFYLVF